MSEKLMNTETKLTNIKRRCKEQLWLIVLFAPLLFVAILVGETDKPEAIQANAIGAENSEPSFNAEEQVTSLELAAIIAKPIEELVLTEVYFESRHVAHSKQPVFNIKHNQLVNDRVSMKQADSSLAKMRIVHLMEENS